MGVAVILWYTVSRYRSVSRQKRECAMPIKYLGSKRKLISPLMQVVAAAEAGTALDAFTGTTRVAQAMKSAGVDVTASDIATYSKVFADCYIAIDARKIDSAELSEAIAHLMSLPGKRGYFTETFCEESRFIQPKNGERIDAMREVIEAEYKDSELYPILLTSLIEAADRVDSTTGVQMAYLKKWATRSNNDIELRVPELLPGKGKAVLCDVFDVIAEVEKQDLIYLDPPYNQHRYFTNYHIWETLVRWDAPEHYGVACKRIDSRDEETKSVFNKKREAPNALYKLFDACRSKCDTLVVSYNDESWIDKPTMSVALEKAGFEDVCVLEYDYDRYVGARIGIYNPSGDKVGQVSHTKNHEYIYVAGSADQVRAIQSAML